jgi:hypothetical protein
MSGSLVHSSPAGRVQARSIRHSHVTNIFARICVQTRSSGAMFAMRSGSAEPIFKPPGQMSCTWARFQPQEMDICPLWDEVREPYRDDTPDWRVGSRDVALAICQRLRLATRDMTA